MRYRFKGYDDLYRRINHPTKFERWCDGLPEWVDWVLIVFKMGLVGLIVLSFIK